MMATDSDDESSSIGGDLEKMDHEIAQVKLELQQVCTTGNKARVRRQMEANELMEKLVSIEKATQARMYKSMEKQESPSRIYIEAVKKMRRPDPPEGEDDDDDSDQAVKTVPPYIISLEAQLCRSIHHMVMMEIQLKHLLAQNKELVEWIKSVLSHIEKGVQTMQVKQKYSMLDREIKDMTRDCQLTLQHQREAMERFDVEQSDGLDIVNICRHEELHHSKKQLFVYEPPQLQPISVYNSKQDDRFAFAIRRLFRSGDKPLSLE